MKKNEKLTERQKEKSVERNTLPFPKKYLDQGLQFGDFGPDNNLSEWKLNSNKRPKPRSSNSSSEDTFIEASLLLKKQIRGQVKEGSLKQGSRESANTVVTTQGIIGNKTHITNDKGWRNMHVTTEGSDGKKLSYRNGI